MEERERKPFTLRLWVFSAIVVLVFIILGFNLWRLQIAKGSYYATMAQGNFMNHVNITPMRGDIIDSRGKLLVSSEPRFALQLDWMDLQKVKNADWKEVVKKLAGYIKPFWPNQAQSQDSIMEDILVAIQNHQWERYRPVTILSSVDPKLQAIIAEHQEELPGVSVEALPVRTYPQQTKAGQVLGYVQEISQGELEQFNKNPLAQKEGFKYGAGDLVGKMGLEKSYDYWLRGKEGIQQVEVDNNAKPVAKRLLQPPQPGKTLQLTINGELQKVVEDELEKVVNDIKRTENPQAEVGAAVVIEVKTGKILAMSSRPFMNPNDLIGKISDETATKYFTGEAAASFNRALSGQYAPGSTYKMLTGMAALHAKVVDPYDSFDDSKAALGPAAVQAQAVGEWGGNHFGRINLFRGLAKSSNIYFQLVGRRVFDNNPELMKQLSNEFGLGVLSGIDIPGEAKGVAPSAEWKKAQFTPGYDKLKEQKLATIESDFATKIDQAADEKSKQKLKVQMENKKKEVDVWYKQMISQVVDWRLYDSFNNSIGQGYNTYTPLQLANYVATIVNGGNRMKPYLVDKILDPVTGKVVYENKPQVVNRVSVSPETLNYVKMAMREVTRGEGTGSGLFYDVPEFTGGGKTGTAQIGSKNTIAGDLYNGVFVAFAPYDDPQIAFAGIVEYGYHGSTSAGYVARAAFMKYFGWKSTNGS